MRIRSFLMVGLVVASLAANAGATTSVYFTATSGGVQTQGVEGGILELNGGGPWTIEMRVQTDKSLQTWGLDLTNVGTFQASNSVANTATWPGASGGVPGAGPALLVGDGFIDLSPPFAAAGNHQLLSFTLSGGAIGQTITGIVNINEWVDGDAGDYDPQTRFGNGPFAPGSLGRTTGTLITLVPEPATLSLLVLGGFATALRRRRSR